MAQKTKLSNVEFESIMLYLFVSLLMAIRAVHLLTMSQENINDSDFYILMDALLPVQIWGGVVLIGALFVAGCVLSMTRRKYVMLIIGSSFGLLPGGAMAILGFIEGMNIFTPLQAGVVAFFNLALLAHGSVVLWKEKKKIPM